MFCVFPEFSSFNLPSFTPINSSTSKMKIIISFIFINIVVQSLAAPRRAKREAYMLPDGVELLLGDIRATFTCPGDGYYADTDNNCQIFHVCHGYQDGAPQPSQWSFACGNQTVFNQLTFTCSYPEDAIPCENAPEYFRLNGNVLLGDPDVPFLNDDDIQNAAAIIPGHGNYGTRTGQERPRG